MVREAGPPAHIGISLGPHRSQALGVRDRTVLASVAVAGSAPAELLSLIGPAHRAPARSVTIAIRRLLLEPVLHRPGELSSGGRGGGRAGAAAGPARGRRPAEGGGRRGARRGAGPGGRD